jgi:hypothetical protein
VITRPIYKPATPAGFFNGAKGEKWQQWEWEMAAEMANPFIHF